jgi:hypothetical protein
LDQATNTLRDVATKYNPLMVMKALREGVGTTAVNPVVGGLQGVATELMSPQFRDTTRTKPTGIAEKTATDFMQRNAPTTPMAQEFSEGVGKLTQDLPAYLGHLSTNRPVLTPNDVRVMGAEATRLGRQVRDIPSDFANAQAGVQRIDPVTGQPTMGTKLQAGAESIGDMIERRRSQGLAPVPGLPETLQPETSMYAIRPSGSRLALPQVPKELEGKKFYTDMQRNAAPYKLLDNIVDEELAYKDLSPSMLERHIEAIRIDKNIDAKPFEDYVLRKAQEMYPDAPSSYDAVEAWKRRFTNRDDLNEAQLQMLDEFLKTPEGQASPMSAIPGPNQLQERHKAAMSWLRGPWINYINKHVGSSGDPAVKLASQGLTYLPADTIRETATEIDMDPVRAARAAVNMPSEGEVAPAYTQKSAELAAAQADLDKWQTRREAYRDIAMRQGLGDPAELPDYAATTAPIRQLVAQIAKLEDEKNALSLGKDYETVADAAINVKTQPKAIADLDYTERQFYPSVTRARPEDLIYGVPGTGRLSRLGLDVLAKDVYYKVMSGEIPIEQLPKLSVDKIIRDTAEPRVKAEKAAAKQQAQWKSTAENVMQQTMQTYVPPENYFGNVGVIELGPQSGLSKEQMTKILSEATTVLDHCIAQGGDAGGRRKNPWHPDHNVYYEPIYDVSTGERNPRAKRDISTYAADIVDYGNMIADIRDQSTGLPVATLELGKSHVEPSGKQMYYVGWASGARNGRVDAKYQGSIKDYLNSRADVIASAGNNLERNLNILDLQDPNMDQADYLRAADVRRAGASDVDLSGLPRFVTHKEIKAYVDDILDNAPQTPVQQAPAQSGTLNMQALAGDITSARSSAYSLAASDFGPSTTRMVERVLGDATQNLEGISNDPIAFAGALRDTISLLQDFHENAMSLRGTTTESAGDVVAEFIIDLEGILHSVERGHYDVMPAEAPPPQARISRVDDFDNFITRTRHDLGTDISERVETVALRIAENLTPGGTIAAAMNRAPDIFADHLRRAGAREQNELVEVSLNELADMLVPRVPDAGEALPDLGFQQPQAPATPTPFTVQDFDGWIQMVNTDLGFTAADRFVRVANRIVADIGSQTIGQAIEINPTAFAEALSAASEDPNNAAISRALSDVADLIAPPIRDNLQANNVLQLNVDDMAFELFNDTRQGDDPNSPRNLEELRSTLYALDNATFDDARFRALPADRREQAQRDVAQTIRQIMNDTGVTLPAEQQGLQQLGQQTPEATAAFEPIVDDASNMTLRDLQDSLDPQEMGEVAAVADDILRFNADPADISRIADMVHNHIISGWADFNDRQRALLVIKLHAAASEALRNQRPPQGYQDGGSVKYPGFFGARGEAIERAQEMHPSYEAQDNQTDAARHMLASGYMAQSLNPTIAKGLGWLHEFKEAPLRTAGHALGISNPRYDYEMDMHNNALGVELAQKAKDRPEFERLVQDAIKQGTTSTQPGRVRLMTPKQAEEGRGRLKYANGGTVAPTPSLDTMKYELLLRSK